ncbi:hypothetical protein GF366_01650 [Candidatus Peregrinibacteria bacterium]|nr:hypothetical protein [Candidatus Peregrinibacteria bacterium]
MFKAKRGTILLQPEMRKRVLAFMAHCKDAGLNVYITETGRSKARQLYLWAKGRYLPLSTEVGYLGYDDPDIYSKPKERKVTWTLKSKHIEGLAIDICFKTENGITYNGDWEKTFDIAESCGLQSLWRKYGFDKPHLEFNPGWTPPDEERKKKIRGLERQYRIDAERANLAVRKLNETRKLLANAKGVKFKEHKII